MVYSSSFILAERSDAFKSGNFFFKKHLMWVLISVLAFIFIKEVPYQTWQKYNWMILAGVFVLLLAVFIPGIGRGYFGAHRWLKFGPISFQPSELAKLALIIFLASFISKDPERIKDFKRGLLPLMLVSGALLGLIMIEPDLGTAIFLCLVCGIILFMSGIRMTFIIPIVLAAISGMVILGLTIFPHVMTRLLVFFNPLGDPLGKGYQINQALIGLGSGGITGAGLGLSKQKLFYLPQQHTDFILSIIGEETGFIGIVVVLLLFMALFLIGWKVYRKSNNQFAAILSLGITLLITIQALINIAVVTASVPTKGIGLPFISFGGSALFAAMCAVGILINIARQSEKERKKAV
jgi:cell division protein FtsW